VKATFFDHATMDSEDEKVGVVESRLPNVDISNLYARDNKLEKR